MRNVLVIAALVVGVFLVIHLGKAVSAKDPPPHGHSNSVAITFNTIQTYRTVTVSPAAVNCGNYASGKNPVHGAKLQPAKRHGYADQRQQRVRRALPTAERLRGQTRRLPA